MKKEKIVNILVSLIGLSLILLSAWLAGGVEFLKIFTTALAFLVGAIVLSFGIAKLLND